MALVNDIIPRKGLLVASQRARGSSTREGAAPARGISGVKRAGDGSVEKPGTASVLPGAP